MRLPRSLLGRVVVLEWADPNAFKGRIRDVRRGRAALATWREFGSVWDITDGVVLLAHSLGRDPGATEDDEVYFSAIPEDNIEKIMTYSPDQKEVAG